METTLKTKKEISNYLNCSMGSIDNMMKDKKISYFKIGKLVRFDINELNRELGISTRNELDKVLKENIENG